MLTTSESFLATDKLFQKLIPLDNFNQQIILIDKDNFHKEIILNLFKNEFYPYLKNNIKITFMDEANIDFNIKNSIICVPIAFEKVDIKKWIKLANNNIVIAAVDEEYQYPWCISNIFSANYTLHWATNINEQDIGITGTSVYCVFLSILALNGKDFLLKFIKEVNKNEP